MEGLNPQQLRAATAPGSVAVTAGAGTGKTHMLAARYLFHVREQDLSPLAVVAVTFTEKGADELRSRIRETLAEAGLSDEKIAEVDAAQISTIHALGARICRDFYDVAGIPADFAILDQVESPMWLATKRDEAIGSVDPVVIDELGYDRLRQFLPILLDDPYTAKRALAISPETIKAEMEREFAAALGELRRSDEWRAAVETIHEICPSRPDALEDARQAAIAMTAAAETGGDVRAAITAFVASRPDRGQQGNWPGGGKARIQPILRALKSRVQEVRERLSLSFDEEDEEMFGLVSLLRPAFEQAYTYLAEQKRLENVLDFADIETYALKVLNHPAGEALEHYGKRWQAFLIDEFQDTSPAQEELLDLLTRDARRTVVGDEKQAIYGFRGADIDVFRRFREKITADPGGQEVELSSTYRTHGPLVEATNAVFEPILGELHQPLVSARTDTGQIDGPYLGAAEVGEPEADVYSRPEIVEAHYIAQRIKAIVDGGAMIYDKSLQSTRQAAYRDIAILTRKWEPLDAILEVLSAAGVPAVNIGGGNLLGTQEAIDAFSLLSFLAEPADNIPLVAVLRSPLAGISDTELFDIADGIPSRGSWWPVILQAERTADISALLDHLLAARRKLSAADLLRLADRLTGYSAIAANLPHGARREADWRGVIELLDQMERRGRGGLFDAVRQLSQLVETKTDVPRPRLDAGDAVSLMTVHTAKGLEWPIVFVAALSTKGRLFGPSIYVDRDLGVAFATEGEGFDRTKCGTLTLHGIRAAAREADEAKRVLYVALTRARDRVHLSAAEARSACDFETLRPGLENAGIAVETLEYRPEFARIAAPAEPKAPAAAVEMQTQSVPESVFATSAVGLTSYAHCPKQFRYRFVEGHPGAGEGAAHASNIGTATHFALENDITDITALAKRFPEMEPGEAAEAIRLAENFRNHDVFAPFRLVPGRREQPFSLEIGGITLRGAADLVGPDFVLDFKTDAVVDEGHHRFQVWAYAEAFEKQQGVLAYLRQREVRVFSWEELGAIGRDAEIVIAGIVGGNYQPTPSAEKCERCLYKAICPESAA
jgi:ATP-dependent helicase/nuclease subunit A